MTRTAIQPAPGTPSDPPSGALERYLEAIYYIVHEGEVARPGRIAEWLGVSAPTVTVTVRRLVRDGFVSVEGDRSVRLTDAGEQLAARIVRRHRLLERWLTDVLGLDWARADEEAHMLAGGISDAVLERLDAHLDRPLTCPHGNVIPGRSAVRRHLVPLVAAEVGTVGTIARVSEVGEHEAPEMLDVLYRAGLVPGARLAVHQGSGGDSLVVGVEGRPVPLARRFASRIWLETDGTNRP